MARLPDIETIAVQETSDLPLKVDAARRKSIEVVEKGLTELGTELVNTQKLKAKAVFAQELGNAETAIDATQSVSTQFLRDQLGPDFDTLDPAIRSHLVERGLDINTGKEAEFDKQNIPMSLVAGLIYDSKAKQALAAASKHIDSDGWRKSFQDEAQAEIAQRKVVLNRAQMKKLVDYLNAEQTTATLEQASAASAIVDPTLRAAKFAEIRQGIATSKSMDPAYKVTLAGQVDKVEQIAPVYGAIRRNDYAEMAVQLGKLNDPNEFTKLSPEERTANSERLKAELKQFKTAVDEEKKRVLRQNADAGWNAILTKIRNGESPAYSDIPPPGTVSPDEQRQMIEYIDNKAKGVDPKTDGKTYYMLTQMWRDHPEQFAGLQLTKFLNRLSPSDFQHFVDLQTKPGGEAKFDDVVNTDEAINASLFLHLKIDGKKPKDDQETEDVARVKALIQTELSKLGRRATLEERNKIIDEVVQKEKETESHWYGDRQRLSASRGVPPGFTSAFREVHAQVARATSNVSADFSPAALRAAYQDFQVYGGDIERAWRLAAPKGKVFTPPEAVRVWGLLKMKWGEIDAELARKGNALTNANRAALAVTAYLEATSR